MLPNLVGVRIVSEPKVLRDWALHFPPADGGTLAQFFREIASGGNDSGDGFRVPASYDVSRVQARVSEEKGGQEMPIPASASFRDATKFGQWFTFHLSARKDVSAKPAAVRDAAQTVSERSTANEKSTSWMSTIAAQSPGVSQSGKSFNAAAAPLSNSNMSLSQESGQGSVKGSSQAESQPVVPPPVPPLQFGSGLGKQPPRLCSAYGQESTDEGSSSEESGASSDSDLECNTHKTTNLDEEEEASEGSPAVGSSQDALSSVHESFMQLMHKLLRAMPSTPQSARLLQCANPPYTPTGRQQGCNGDHTRLSGPCHICSPDDIGAWTYNISQLVFDYITTVMFDEGIMLDVDYNAWEGVLLVVENNATACKVALAKLGENPDIAGKCLMGENPSACKDFAYLFCKAVIRHSHITHRLVKRDVESSPVHKLGSGLLSIFDAVGDCTSCDVVPLFDVVCSCVLVTLQLDYKELWTRAVLALGKVSSNLAANAWGGQAVQVLKLETINKIFARLVREGLIHGKTSSEAPYELPVDMRESFAHHEHLAKGFVHPLMLVKDEFVEFVQAYIWDCDTTTFQVLMGLEELLADENAFSGHDFEQISNSIYKIVDINDRFKTHRMVYWLFRPEEKKAGVWHMAFGRFGRQHRWRLLHLLMKLSDCGDETRENFKKMPNWGRLIGWMIKDGAAEGGTVPGDVGINKGVILEWAQQFEGEAETPMSNAYSSSSKRSSHKHTRQHSIDHI